MITIVKYTLNIVNNKCKLDINKQCLGSRRYNRGAYTMIFITLYAFGYFGSLNYKLSTAANENKS